MPTIKDYTTLPGFETKEFVPITTSIDEEKGIVEAIVAVMGNVDYQGDVIIPGAFAKTIVERGPDILVLDNHRTDSNDAIVGKMLGLREIGRGDLPTSLTEKFPEATGALMARMQFLLQTTEGAGIFERIKARAVKKYSIGYDPMQKDFETLGEGDDRTTIRNLREIRLWEVSVVPFAANDATMTVSAKAADAEPSEGKPYIIRRRDDELCVYKADDEGHPEGEPLKCYADRREAEAYLRALDTNVEDAGDDTMDELPEKAAAEAPELKEGRVLSSANATRIIGAMTSLLNTLEAAGLDMPGWTKQEAEVEDDEEKSSAPTPGRAGDSEHDEKAGPGPQPPTDGDVLAQLKMLGLEISLLEVT